jgi:hypothetical protein
MVALAFGAVQLAGVFDGGDDSGADGGRVGRPAAGPAGRGVFAEDHGADVVVRLGGPVLADQPGQILLARMIRARAAGRCGPGIMSRSTSDFRSCRIWAARVMHQCRARSEWRTETRPRL